VADSDQQRLARLQRDHGVNVALGSDWPATYGSGTLGIRPFLNIQAAILRQPPPPSQADAFTLEGALQAYTLAGARQMGLEAITGSIRVGKRADLVLLDRDLTAIPTEDIHRTNVLLTLMDGRSTGVDRS
jgi:predicted amidohydrolase YtcJ